MRGFIAAALFVLATSISLPAQRAAADSLALHWTHVHGSPYFVGNVPSTESLYGVVDRLGTVFWLDYLSAPRTLDAGTYAARVRLKKRTSTAGRQPLTLSVSGNGVASSVTLLAQDQAVDQWVETPPLLFTVSPATGPLVFRLSNTSNSFAKMDYDFDAFTVKPLPLVLRCASDLTFLNQESFTNEATPEAASGLVKRVNADNLTYLYAAQPVAMMLPPGTYGMRLRAWFSPAPAYSGGLTTPSPLRGHVHVNGVEHVMAMMPAETQPYGTWFDTPPAYFSVSGLDASVVVGFGDTAPGYRFKNGYRFDRIEIFPAEAGGISLVQDQAAAVGSNLSFDIVVPGSTTGTTVYTGFALTAAGGIDIGGGLRIPLDLDDLLALSLMPGNGIFTNNLSSTVEYLTQLRPTIAIPAVPALAGFTLYGSSVAIGANNAIVGIAPAVPVTLQ